jgi:hypothetical protein
MTTSKFFLRISIFKSIFLILLFVMGCEKGIENPPDKKELVEGVDYFLPDIDLKNWKVTLPIGAPTEVFPPAILGYGTNTTLKPFMYNDSTDGSIVFYTYPASSTANSSYSRTELRELLDIQGKVNWTFSQGGRMKGTLAVPEISKDAGGNPHCTIIMQIHGRLTDEQRDLIGQGDNNAPPVLKIYWEKGKLVVKTKMLKDLNDTYEESLHTDAWKDAPGKTFARTVGTEKFTLEVIASEGRLEVTLDDSETFVYNDVHMQKWGVFENYFKAGNYLVTTDEGAFARVKYYKLEVSHE